MSRLPPGTKAARNFLETIILNGAMAKAVAFMPWLGWPIIRDILKGLLEHLLVDPALDELTAKALALTYVIDQRAFDKSFIRLAMLDKQNATPEALEEALNATQKDMARFIRRGPVT